MVGILLSSWGGLFSGAMLVFPGGVYLLRFEAHPIPQSICLSRSQVCMQTQRFKEVFFSVKVSGTQNGGVLYLIGVGLGVPLRIRRIHTTYMTVFGWTLHLDGTFPKCLVRFHGLVPKKPLEVVFFMASQPTPPRRTPPRNKCLIRPY